MRRAGCRRPLPPSNGGLTRCYMKIVWRPAERKGVARPACAGGDKGGAAHAEQRRGQLHQHAPPLACSFPLLAPPSTMPSWPSPIRDDGATASRRGRRDRQARRHGDESAGDGVERAAPGRSTPMSLAAPIRPARIGCQGFPATKVLMQATSQKETQPRLPTWVCRPDITDVSDHHLKFPMWVAMAGAAMIGSRACARTNRKKKTLVITGDREKRYGHRCGRHNRDPASEERSVVVLDTT